MSFAFSSKSARSRLSKSLRPKKDTRWFRRKAAVRKLSEDVTSAQVFSKMAKTGSGVPRGANMPFKPGTPDA
jgi:hypothetical protein